MILLLIFVCSEHTSYTVDTTFFEGKLKRVIINLMNRKLIDLKGFFLAVKMATINENELNLPKIIAFLKQKNLIYLHFPLSSCFELLFLLFKLASSPMSNFSPSCLFMKYVTLHGKTGTKVIARSQHASTSKQKNLILARLRHVQNLASLLNPLFYRTRKKQ